MKVCGVTEHQGVGEETEAGETAYSNRGIGE